MCRSRRGVVLTTRSNAAVLWSIQDECCDVAEVDEWMESMKTNMLPYLEKSTDKEMKLRLRKDGYNQTTREYLIGLKIETMNVKKNKLKYKLVTGMGYLDSRVYSGHGPPLMIHGLDPAKDAYKMQYLIETAFQQHAEYKNTNVNKTYPNATLQRMPRPEKILTTFNQVAFFVMCPVSLILIVLYTARNIVSERESIKPYLSVMGLSTSTFYLSHCILAFMYILLISLTQFVFIFKGIPNFAWSLATVTLILFSMTVTAYTAMFGSLFTSSSTAVQLTLLLWLAICFTPMVLMADALTHTALASVQSLLPGYALHYIIKYLLAVNDYELGAWTELANSRLTGQAIIGPLLVLAFCPILMTGIICIFEKKLWKKFGSLCRKKIYNDENSQKEIKLKNADEKFEVDEKDADIILKGVYKEYPCGVKAVSGLDMMALRGQVTVLLGHNGAGKTTTFSMICGVEEASDGTVEVGGYPAGSLKSRQTIGYCAQVNTLIDQMTVKDHLWLAHGLKRAEGNYWDEGEQLMETLELENKRVTKLSGGQKRKLCVAMALIGNSRVVLLDEPTAGMDPESRRDVEKMLEEAKKERTILLTTHYMDEAETLGDRIFIMADGHGVCSGSPQFLKKRFGTGYVLTLVAAEGSTGPQLAKQMEPLVQKYTAGAKLGEIRGKQVEMSIPIEEQRHFPDLFEQIESSQQDLHISSFGLSLNSLEQVFLHVCSLTDKEKSKRDVPLADELAELYDEEKREGFALYLHQFYAVLIKKFIYTIRFWSQLATQIGLPLLSIIVALAMYAFSGIGQTNLDVKIPPGELMFMRYGVRNLEVDRLETRGVDTVGSGQEIKDYLRKNLGKHYHLGLDFPTRGPIIELLYNSIYALAPAEAINTLSWLRSNESDISLSIEVLYDTSNTQSFGLGKAILLLFLVTLTICQLVVTMIEDRVSRFAHQQLLTGMKPTVYWLGEVVYCLLIFGSQTAVYLFSATLIGLVTYGAAINLLLMLLLYFWSTIPIVIVFSRFMNSGSKGALLLFVVLFGSFIIVYLIAYGAFILTGEMLFNIYEANPARMTGWDYLFFIFRLGIPSFTIVELMSAYVAYSNGVDGKIEDPEALIALHCICLAITGAAGLIFFLFLQQRHIRYGIFRACKAPRGRKYIPEDAIIPEDSVRNATEGQAMLETTDMSKVYGKNCALAHLSLSVRTNEIFGLLGVSGAGKTTAFNILTGQMFATEGTAAIDGIDCRKKIVLGFCPQFDAIHKIFTGREALTLLARIHGYKNPKQTADRVLDMVKMDEHGRKRLARCSGGQKRRISVAGSLLTTKSPIIILDEATAGIDPKARGDIWEVISAARNHAAVLMTSHSMDECEALCNRIGILKQGGLAIVGTSQSLKSRYGNFYTLSMALPSSDLKEKVTKEVADWFPGSILKSDGFSLHLKWQVPKKSTDRWSTVFASCLELSERVGVVDFCLTQSTLQDIFLLLAGHDAISLDEIQQPTSQSKPATSASRTSSNEPTGRSGARTVSAEKTDAQESQQLLVDEEQSK